VLTALRSRFQTLINHQGIRRYSANTSWMLAEKILRIIAGLLVGIWIARSLGPDQYGLFNYVLAFLAIFSGIVKLGLDGVVVRELVNQPAHQSIYLGTAFWLKVIMAVTVIGFLAAMLPIVPIEEKTKWLIFIVGAGLIFNGFEVIEFYFESKVQAKVISICKVVQLTISSIFKVGLVVVDADLIWFVLVCVIDAGSLAAAYTLAYKINVRSTFMNEFNFFVAKKLIKSSFPMMLSTILIAVYMKSDIIIISQLLDDHSVGLYSAGIRLVESVFFVPMVISSSIFPAILNAKKRGDQAFYKALQGIYTFMTWLAILVSIIFMTQNGFLISILFGEEYQRSSAVLFVYSLVLMPLFVSVINDKWFYVFDKGYVLMFKIGSGAFSNVCLNYMLIPKFGIIGAAWATVVSFYVSVFLSDLFFVSARKTLILKLNAIFPLYLAKRFF